MTTTDEIDITLKDRWFRGADKLFIVTVLKPDKSAWDITGWTIEADFAFTKGGPPQLSIPAIHFDNVGGVVHFTVNGDDTIGWDADRYYFWSLRRTDVGSRDELLPGGKAWLREVFAGYESEAS